MNPDAFRRVGPGVSGRPYWRDCLVVSLAVGVIGVTFGVFADAAGFDLAQIVVMSALVFTGASQFAAVGVIDDGGSGGAAVGSALLLALPRCRRGRRSARDVAQGTAARRGGGGHGRHRCPASDYVAGGAAAARRPGYIVNVLGQSSGRMRASVPPST